MPDRDPIYTAVLDLLGVRPTPRRREEVAQLLREHAGKQERLADLERATGHVPHGAEPRTQGTRGRAPARWVSVAWVKHAEVRGATLVLGERVG